MEHQKKSWPSLFTGAMPAASFLCALMNFQKGLVSLFSKALAIVLLIKSALALWRHWVTVFLQCLYLDHMDSLWARFMNNRFFLRMRRRIGRLIQGTWYLEDVILLGTYWFTIRSSFPLKVFHLVSTSISVNFWKYLVLNIPLTQWFSQSMSGKFRSPPIMTTLLANLPTFPISLSNASLNLSRWACLWSGGR